MTNRRVERGVRCAEVKSSQPSPQNVIDCSASGQSPARLLGADRIAIGHVLFEALLRILQVALLEDTPPR